MRKLLFFSFVILGLAFTVAWSMGVFEERYHYRKESVTILKALTSGEESAIKVYEEATFALQEASLIGSFVQKSDNITETLGRFLAIERVEKIEILDTIRGKTARIEYWVRFELASTSAELSYLRGDDKKWSLLGYTISVPAEFEEQVRIFNLDEHNKAPKEVLELADEILKMIAAGRASEVHAHASPPFRDSISEEGFLRLVARHKKELGAFLQREVVSSVENNSKSRSTVRMNLSYEKEKTVGTMGFLKNRGKWYLYYFKVLIPKPLLPNRTNE